MRILAIVAALVASTPEAQTLSPQARAVFSDWHLCAPAGVPASALIGSRRFAGNTLTWRVQPTGSWAPYVREAQAKIQGLMRGVLTLREVPYSTSADITFRIGTSYTPQGGATLPLTNGCVTNHRVADDHLTYTSIEIVCKNVDQVGVDLAMHEEWWHGFLSFCHTASGWASGGGALGGPDFEGVPGHREAVRWIYSVPAGSLPPK